MTEWGEGFLWGFGLAWAGAIFNKWVENRRFKRAADEVMVAIEKRRKELSGDDS